MNELSIAILAAGKGTRMKSQIPKVLHRLGSQTLLDRVVTTSLRLNPRTCWVIVGYGSDQVKASLEETLAHYQDPHCPIVFVEQADQKGTGHAVQQLIPYLQGCTDDLLVMNADVPLLQGETLQRLLDYHRQHQASVTVLSAKVSDPTGYGRVFVDASGCVSEIIEHRDCTLEQRSNTRINSGIYCFRWPELAQVLPQLTANNQQGEYYLTDTISLLPKAYTLDVENSQEIIGINDRIQLATAQKILQERIKLNWMKAGVTLLDPDSITIEDSVHIEPDVIIEPQTHLRGKTLIRQGSQIGPGSLIRNSVIGENCHVVWSTISDSIIGAETTVGPYAHIRTQSEVASHCRLGNFVEIKNASIQDDTNVAHLSYIGDASLGKKVNIGAGTIIANYDGVKKHHTTIGNSSKTGANSVLIAPLTIGEGVTIAGGSTVTHDVPDDCLVIARARQVIKPGWRLGQKKSSLLSSDLPGSFEIYPLRLSPEQDLKQALWDYTQSYQLQAGFIITAVGSLQAVSLRFANKEEVTCLQGRFEIVSLVGSLCQDGVHLHLAVANERGEMIGGHLAGGQIYTTTEIILGESKNHRFSRQLDPATGYMELTISARG
jgi:bifunctional UDP-N-acetylglucosamine pyrophosphorylase/glucosamine-1-phosphate N-acetyltransferase